MRSAGQIRHASDSSWYSKRWVDIVRSESNIVTVDDPPTAPLSENHEVGDGVSDFSNWIEQHNDVSDVQALTGLGTILAFCAGVFYVSTTRANNSTPLFTLREFPYVENDFKTYAGASSIRKE